MLCLLKIANLALVESLEIEFAPGLNVLTGETGSGKSIILEAIELLLGERAAPSCVRTGSSRAEVEAVIDLRGRDHVKSWLEAQGLLSDEADELVLRREILVKGRSRAWINGRLVPVGQLAELGRLLADIHAQHQTNSLTIPAKQRDLLDAFGQLEPLRNAMAEAWRTHAALRRRIEALDSDDRQWRQRLDFIDYQIAEIESLALRPGEEVELTAERHRLANVGTLTNGLTRVIGLLFEGDETSAVDLIGQAQQELSNLAGLDESLSSSVEALDDIASRLSDLSRDLATYGSRLESDPERLEEVEDRLEAIRRLERKHGKGTAAIVESLAAMRAEADALRNRETERAELERQMAASRTSVEKAARELSKARSRTATALQKKVATILKNLALPDARFEVALIPGEPGLDGAETVEFQFSANPGEPIKPLREVASGGELSRVMLALHTLAAAKDRLPLLVFDEIDTGLSGQAARQVAGVLAGIAAQHQVLCVTHQPVIASRADRHFAVSKTPQNGRMVTCVESIAGDSRRREVARLLDGGVSAQGLALADEMLGKEAITAS